MPGGDEGIVEVGDDELEMSGRVRELGVEAIRVAGRSAGVLARPEVLLLLGRHLFEAAEMITSSASSSVSLWTE